ncbi:rhamnogalacturonan acetylesterase [Paenibacillus sedimenti]|nr:rhamnogalacturonan acetylesterase [Paenibacillus sedimenti]
MNIFLAGDSTMSEYDAATAPRAGWGQMLGSLLNGKAEVRNAAASGRSSKSFIDEGRLAPIEEAIGAGDFLLIQFGHNDEKDDEVRHTEPFGTYQFYLNQYIETAKSKQAYPILITPVQRRKFGENGKLQDTHGQYPEAMKQLAAERGVPLIDLAALSKELLEQLGPEASKKLFLWLDPGEHPNYPDGVQDDTHFSEHGAREIAKLIVDKLHEMGW